MANHSRIGASTCERWWNCPGSVRLVAQCPPQLPSPWADEGTVAHLVGEWGLRTGRDAAEFIGRTAVQIVTKDGDRQYEFKEDIHIFKDATLTGAEIEVTEEMAEAVQIYLDTIRFDMETYGLKLADIKIEHRFHLTSIHKDAFGTNDCNLPIPFDRVIVYDYKHGKGVTVDAEENKQLMYYALGACQEGDFNEVEIVIVQPRGSGDPIRRWSLSIVELERFATELKGKIEETRDPKAPLNCGAWCKKTFCPAMAICPAVRGRVENDAQLAFADSNTAIAFPTPESMSPALLRRVLDGMELMDAWLKAVWSYAETVANNGETIPGYKLVRGRQGNRKWKDEEYAGPLLEGGANILNLTVYEKKLLSPSQVEKILKGKENKENIEKLTIRAEGKIALVPENDPREAVNPSAIEAFKQQDSIESLL